MPVDNGVSSPLDDESGDVIARVASKLDSHVERMPTPAEERIEQVEQSGENLARVSPVGHLVAVADETTVRDDGLGMHALDAGEQHGEATGRETAQDDRLVKVVRHPGSGCIDLSSLTLAPSVLATSQGVRKVDE